MAFCKALQFSHRRTKEGGIMINYRIAKQLLIVILVLCLAALALAAQQATEGRPIVLRGATVINGMGDPPIPDAVVRLTER